ncbi:MAG TPA: polyprenol monophosphomannose synthase [Thermoleophilaceae bacterium]
MTGAWLVLPTYNEAENIVPFVRAVLPQLASAAPDHHLLIVDDNSPDGTGALADELALEFEQVEVFHRPAKQGLGRAYLAGFRRALDSGADLILEMDADFSHDPADVPRLIEAAASSDLVLGSRYVRGGGVSDWGLLRRLVSRGGCWYAQHMLRVPVRDLTGGFKCFNRKVLEEIHLDSVHADGYGFQIELTYYALKGGFSVREIPITFRERQVGTSKMSPRIALEAVWKVPALKLRRDR